MIQAIVSNERIKVSGDYGISRAEDGFNKKSELRAKRCWQKLWPPYEVIGLNGVPVSDSGTTRCS